MTEEVAEKSLLDYGFEQKQEPNHITELGVSILQEFVVGGHIKAGIEEDDLVLSTFIVEDDVGEDFELGRINFYHVVGFTAERLAEDRDEKALSDLATLFRNIATLVDQTAMRLQYPSSGDFFAAHVIPTLQAPYSIDEDDEGPSS